MSWKLAMTGFAVTMVAAGVSNRLYIVFIAFIETD
jgi:hypothetical protein